MQEAMKSKNARFKSVKFQTISGILVYLNSGKLSQLDLKQVRKVKSLSFFSKYLSLLKKYAGLLSGDYKFIKGGKTLQKRRIKNFNLSSYKRKLVEKILALESRQLERKINRVFHEPRESSLPSASLEHISKLQSRPGTSIEIYERRGKFLRERKMDCFNNTDHMGSLQINEPNFNPRKDSQGDQASRFLDILDSPENSEGEEEHQPKDFSVELNFGQEETKNSEV